MSRIKSFFELEAAGGIVLAFAAVLAIFVPIKPLKRHPPNTLLAHRGHLMGCHVKIRRACDLGRRAFGVFYSFKK